MISFSSLDYFSIVFFSITIQKLPFSLFSFSKGPDFTTICCSWENLDSLFFPCPCDISALFFLVFFLDLSESFSQVADVFFFYGFGYYRAVFEFSKIKAGITWTFLPCAFDWHNLHYFIFFSVLNSRLIFVFSWQEIQQFCWCFVRAFSFFDRGIF